MLLNKENGRLDLYSKFFLYLFIPASLYLILLVILSLSWRMQLDHAVTFYLSFLIDEYHKVPYKEIYDMNFPGTYFINIVIGKIFGYTDFGIRIADILILTGISAITFSYTKKFSTKSAFAAIIIFALIYFLKRPYTTMQREYFVVAIFAVILFLNFRNSSEKNSITFINGILLGFCFTIKPHSAISILAFTIYRFIVLKYFDKSPNTFRLTLRYLMFLLAGFFIPVLIMIIWLYSSGALNSFAGMVINYFPLYASLNKTHTVLTGFQKYTYIFNEFFQFNERPLLFAAAVFGVYLSMFRLNLPPGLKKNILLLCILTLFFSIYTLFAGQFWDHHWLPYAYFISILSSLCFIESEALKKSEKYFVMFLIMIAVLSLLVPYKGFLSQLKGIDVDKENEQRISEISDYMVKNSLPGEEVQVLDWIGGTSQALLKTKNGSATKFVYDFQFYHHISNPYIQNLRKEFIAELNNKNPRFIIQTFTTRAMPNGFDTSQEFPELKKYIDENYTVDLKGEGYLIYKHK